MNTEQTAGQAGDEGSPSPSFPSQGFDTSASAVQPDAVSDPLPPSGVSLATTPEPLKSGFDMSASAVQPDAIRKRSGSGGSSSTTNPAQAAAALESGFLGWVSAYPRAATALVFAFGWFCGRRRS